MAIVIDQMDIVPAPSPASGTAARGSDGASGQGGGAGGDGGGDKSELEKQAQIERAIRHHHERAARLRAF